MQNIFDSNVAESLIERINRLNPDSQPLWGTMDAGQMLAHCNVTYEMVYENKHPKPNALMKLMLKLFIKKSVVNDVPYKHNGQTAPAFVMKGSKDFEQEKQRLIAFIRQTVDVGTAYFNGRESHSFGVLSIAEWNNMFYKHLSHHLGQFGV